jgi:hypothetical protein
MFKCAISALPCNAHGSHAQNIEGVRLALARDRRSPNAAGTARHAHLKRERRVGNAAYRVVPEDLSYDDDEMF